MVKSIFGLHSEYESNKNLSFLTVSMERPSSFNQSLKTLIELPRTFIELKNDLSEAQIILDKDSLTSDHFGLWSMTVKDSTADLSFAFEVYLVPPCSVRDAN